MDWLPHARTTAPRTATFAAGLLIGLSLISSAAFAEAREVGGNKASWDKACNKSKDCMPVGDLGNGINGYFVHDGKGGGTSVWCDDNNCVADRPKPSKDAAQILQQPALQMNGNAKPMTGNETPAMLLNLR